MARCDVFVDNVSYSIMKKVLESVKSTMVVKLVLSLRLFAIRETSCLMGGETPVCGGFCYENVAREF